MTEKKIYTYQMGEYTIFHTREAGAPHVYLYTFGQHGWTYEPTDWSGNTPYAPVYATVSEAMRHANAWICEQESEEV